MKKFFTLIALLAMTMGASAAGEWVQDYKIDYSSNTGFPFYVMGYVPEWFDGVMTDFGANYKYVATVDDKGNPAEETSDVIVKTQGGVEYYKIGPLDEPAWHQYFIADGIPTELDGAYTVKAMVKASEACTITVNMGWSWSEDPKSAQVAIGTDWEEIEWEYSGIGGASCNLVAQPGTTTATIEWKYVIVGHVQKEQRPVEWIEDLVNGDAEKSWAELGLADVAYNDMENNFKICAWGKEKGHNMDENGEAWNPFPATIGEEEVNGKINHFFIVKGQPATTEGDASSWDNQFWIQSPKAWKAGTQLKIHFRYKASAPVSSTDTQIHKQTPSDYLIWHAIGNIAFTEEWQEFDGTMTIADDMADGWSIAFNLNSVVKDAVDFYFDDLSWQHMKLDEGLFIAASNTETGIEYDFDNAEALVYDDAVQAYTATVGTKGDKSSWVNEIMISTVRGNDAAFKGATLKPSGDYIGEDNWGNYTASNLAKIKLPAAGVWTVYVDTENLQINIIKIEGDKEKEPIQIDPNPTVVVVNGQERDWLSAGGDGNPREDEVGTGETWDNQFFIVANRVLDAGEVTILEFDYESSVEAKTTTQCHAMPGGYIHWGCIGDVNFTPESQHFTYTFTIPNECAGKDMKTIAFNMAEIKGACEYKISNIVWKLEDETESLIDQTGSRNFYVKEGAGTDPHVFGADPGDAVLSIAAGKAASTVTYNLAGQRVTSNYKGIVVKNGSKYLVK